MEKGRGREREWERDNKGEKLGAYTCRMNINVGGLVQYEFVCSAMCAVTHVAGECSSFHLKCMSFTRDSHVFHESTQLSTA